MKIRPLIKNIFLKPFVKSLKNQKGFSLIELIVAIVIIGVLTALVAPRFFAQGDKAKVEATKAQIKSMMGSVKLYKLNNGSYPTTDQGLDALVEAPSSDPAPNNYPADGYMPKIPLDAWGEEFIYESPGANGQPFEIISSGPNRISGDEDDINSWDI